VGIMRIQLSEIFPIKKNPSDLSATMIINMEDYFKAYKAGVDSYRKYRAYFSKAIAKYNAYYANDFFDAATFACSASDRQAIEKSPAWCLIQGSIYEIVKNGVDALISAHRLDIKKNQLELTLKLELTQDKVRVTIQDNGIGFSQKFLASVDSPGKQEAFIGGSDKKRGVQETDGVLPAHPEYFGGVGDGLRELIKKITKTSLEGIYYDKPPISEIVFTNNIDPPGAIIQVTTSRQPLVKAMTQEVVFRPVSIIGDMLARLYTNPNCKIERSALSISESPSSISESPSSISESPSSISESPSSISASTSSIDIKSSSGGSAVVSDASLLSTSDVKCSEPLGPVNVVTKQQQIKTALQMETSANDPKKPDDNFVP